MSFAHTRPGFNNDLHTFSPARERTAADAIKPGDDALMRAETRPTEAPAHANGKPVAKTILPGTHADVVLRIAGRIRTAIGAERFAASFENKAILRIDEQVLEVAAPNKVLAGLLERRFGALLGEAAGAEIGVGSVRFVVAPDLFGPRAEAAEVQAAVIAPHAPVVEPKPMPAKRPAPAPMAGERFRLESFIVGESNRLAYNAALEMAEASPESATYSPLFIHGPCGVGKTHLLGGIAQRFRERHPGAQVRVTGGEAFINEYVAAVRAGDVDKFRRAYRRVDLLVIDDVHFLSNKASTQGELLHTLDELQRAGSRIVLASDEHPRQVRQFSAALVSRFMSGMVAGIAAPDAALREQCIRMFARQRGLMIDDAAVSMLVQRTGHIAGQDPTSVRDIEGLITRIDALHRLVPEYRDAGGSIGVMLVERALGTPGSATIGDTPGSVRSTRPVRIEAIIAQTASVLSVETSDLSGKTRHPRVVLARAIITHLARQMTTLSYPEIARAIGRPNHSTVITAFQRFAKQLEADEPVDAPGAPEARTLSMLVRQIALAIQASKR